MYMFQVFWVNGQLPRDIRDANIIHLYKNKGDRSSCDNHRGISLLSIAGKILARIMLNRITKHILDDVVGFRKQRGTVDMVFAIRQLQEKCVEQHEDLHLLFIDLTKAFDTVTELHSGRYSGSLDAHLDLYRSSAPFMMACFAGS